MSTAKKKWQAESPPARFAHNFANEIERDTWEKGQQAGRWLSQHMYSEKEKREMENYIHSDVVRDLFGIEIEINDTMDVSTEISALLRRTNPDGPRPDTVKKKLNRVGTQKMTIELLQSRDPDGEVLGWLREISAFVQK